MKEEEFMRSAIADAKKNGHHFGAVVVKNNKIISMAGKRPKGDARFHAESQAILKATKKLNKKVLDNCTLYSTCEPCPMCFYMAWITGVKRIVYGSTQKEAIKYGFKEIDVGDKELDKKSGNKIKLVKGFLREECLELFRK
jgi:tRNA(adenine34) deaminase